MKLAMLISILISSTAMSGDILKVRDWTSGDGVALSAELMKKTDDNVTLKRAGDGKVFVMPLSKLSEADQDLIAEEEKNIDRIARVAPYRVGDTPGFTVKFADNAERTWGVAGRLGKEGVLSDSLFSRYWQFADVLSFTPLRMVREDDDRYLVCGEHVAVRVSAKTVETRINQSGNNLVMFQQYVAHTDWSPYSRSLGRSSGMAARTVLFTVKKDMVLKLEKKHLVGIKLEKIGLREYVVISCTVSMK